MSKHPPILHVRIVDDLTGEELADIDAASTADGLAYYLRSRKITDVSESGIRQYVAAAQGRPPGTLETILWVARHPISGALERSVFAEVHGP